MAFPSIVSSTSLVNVAASATLTVARPTGAVNGDLVIISVNARANRFIATAPDGFTQVAQWTSGSTSSHVRSVIYYKVITDIGAEPTDYSVVWDNNPFGIISAVLVRGANTTTPIDVFATATTLTAPSVSTSGADRLILQTAAINSGTTTNAAVFTPPSGVTEVEDNGTRVYGSLGHKEVAVAGASGADAWTTSETGTLVTAASIAINPAFAGNSPPTAHAGSNQTVTEGNTVTLDGTASSDIEGSITYLWTQTAGQSVTLSDATAVQPTFTAPTPSPDPETLTFQLEVTDEDSATSIDTVDISIQTIGAPSAYPTVIGSTVTINSSATMTVAKPSGVMNDDVIFIALHGRANRTITSPPEGFTQVVQWTSGSTTSSHVRSAIYYKVITAAGSEPADYTVAWDGIPFGFITAAAIRNVYLASIVDVYATGTTLTAPSVVTTNSHRLVLQTVGLNSGTVTSGGVFMAPGEVTELQDGGSRVYGALGFKEVDAAGASGADTWSSAEVSTLFTAATIALKPAAEPNSPPTAHAGSNQTVTEGNTVTLDGTASSDIEGSITYLWTQTAGQSVTLSDATAVQPTFTAPTPSPDPETLTFQLEVTDEVSTTGTDTVDIVINGVATPAQGFDTMMYDGNGWVSATVGSWDGSGWQ